MRLKLERVDGYYTGRTSYQYSVFDQLTGKCVGTINIDRYIGKRRVTRTVQLFDRKYSGSFDTHAECVAFVKGIEVVLNHILKAKDATSANTVLNHMLEAKECETPAKPMA
jgi:hypothetical protein